MNTAHAVLIPSYNTGARLFDTIASVRPFGLPIIVVIDGSTDGTGDTLLRRATTDPGLLVRVQPRNQGKGAAVLHGLRLDVHLVVTMRGRLGKGGIRLGGRRWRGRLGALDRRNLQDLARLEVLRLEMIELGQRLRRGENTAPESQC